MILLKNKFIIKISIIFIICLILMILLASLATKDFPINKIINIKEDQSLTSIANYLYYKKVIKSPFLFKISTILISGQKGLYAGDYIFTEKLNIFKVIYRMSNGIQGIPKIKITIPEGTDSSEMAYIYMTKLNAFNAPKFAGLAQREEGYLFPDTYLFFSNAKTETIIKEMKSNFNKKISEIDNEIKAFNKPLTDIIKMASIIEKEAKSYEDKRIIAGILWKRLDKNMLLQVDAPFFYLTEKNNKVLLNDLKIDSPYNTYKYKGLTKSPISNPGIESIKATVNPIKTDYYYYLTGKDGKMRYAETYDGHLRNKNIYLD